MNVFDIVNGRVVLDATSLMVPEFKALYDRDKSVNKDRALREIGYIVFLCSFKSPYFDYNEIDKDIAIRRDYIKDSTWKPDKLVIEGIGAYRLLSETTNMRLLRSARYATEKLAEYFKGVDFAGDGYNAKDVVNNLKSIGDIVDSLVKLEKQVAKEQVEESRLRGGGRKGHYEDFSVLNSVDYGDMEEEVS